MESEWQVCELEETGDFVQFSVSAVPEIWIIRHVDGSLVCYWPAKNCERKIRKRQPPEEGGTYYKCRILFDGAKFPSYKKAKAAEIVGQNCSVMDCAVEADDDDKLNSTMDFEVSDAPDMDITSHNGTDCINGFIVINDDDDIENQIIGNDSSEFNKLMLRNPIVSAISDVDDGDNNLPSIPTVPGYNALFQNDNDFLTSTALDESDSDGTDGLGDDNVDGLVDARVSTLDDLIMSKVLLIESKTSSFIKSIQEELQHVKEMVQRRAADRDRDYFIHDIDEENPVQPIQLNCMVPKVVMFNESIASKERDGRDDTTERMGAKRVNVLNVETIKLPFETAHNVPIDKLYLNDTFVITSQNADRSNKVQNIDVFFDRGESHSISETPETSSGQESAEHNRTFTLPPEDSPSIILLDDSHLINDHKDGTYVDLVNDDNDCNNVDLVSEQNDGDVDLMNNQIDGELSKEFATTSNDGDCAQHHTTVVLPADTKENYKDNEDILELVEGAKSDLVARMKPHANENETEYMNRVVFVAFTKNFLLKELSWKGENGRINLKNGNFLSCWKESYEEKFGQDEKNERVQRHIRRLKGTKRAADKRCEQGKAQPKKPKKN